MSLAVSFSNLPKDLSSGVRALIDFLPFVESDNGVPLTCGSCETGFSVLKTDDGLRILYHRKSDFFRAVSFLPRVYFSGTTVTQQCSVSTLCYMVDCSRNAVMNVSGVKKLIRILACLGYNSLMLYTEDTYEVPDYPYFGHMRGRYSSAELKDLDDYADRYGLELIPCIQTLAHLSSALRWHAFRSVKDTEDILLADFEPTYDFIDSMLKSVSECFRSRRVHIGMDEAHNLGLGTYLDRNGYQNRFEILSKHLLRVISICEKYSLKPMIWSDMYFRLYNHGGYYMREGSIPQEIIDLVPKGVDLVYWDYYSDDRKMLDCMFENHAAFGKPLIFAGGAWKWTGYAPANRLSRRICGIHFDACMRNNCHEIIVTGWGDNGGDASQFSVLPTLSLYAEKAYDPEISEEESCVRFEECFGLSLDAFLALDLPDEIFESLNSSPKNPCKYLLFNGVLNGLVDCHIPSGASEKYLKHADLLLKYADHPQFGYLFSTLASLCYLLEKKSDLSLGVRRAYEAGQKDVLLWYSEKEIPEILSRLDDFIVLLRQQWYLENKTFGFDVQEIRLGGLKEVLRSAAIRLKSFCIGEISSIEELEQPILPYYTNGNGTVPDRMCLNSWADTATASKLAY